MTKKQAIDRLFIMEAAKRSLLAVSDGAKAARLEKDIEALNMAIKTMRKGEGE